MWLRLVARELYDAIEDRAEAAAFARRIGRLAANRRSYDRIERRYALARLLGPVCGLAAPVTELSGRKSGYAVAMQRLIRALRAAQDAEDGEPDAALELSNAYRDLADVAP
ncbi:MAG: hypothetical protein AAGF90_07795, partial [Pseudomonadota bacterium]